MRIKPNTVMALALLLVGTLSACGKSDVEPQGDAWNTKFKEPTDKTDMDLDLGEDMTEDIPEDMPPLPKDDTGAACVDGETCAGGDCLGSRTWPGGYCSQIGCDPIACAAANGTCMFGGLDGRSEDICVKPCNSERECRDGYGCYDINDQGLSACLPEREEPTGAADAEPCQSNNDCAGGTCIPEAEGWPQGYCTTLNCDTREDCARGPNDSLDNRCLRNGQGPNLCVRICTSPNDCREGYTCEPISQNQGICVPGSNITIGDDFDDYPFAITCGLQRQNGQITFDYEIAADTTSYMVTPLAKDLGRLSPRAITLDADQSTVIDFRQQQFQAATSQFFGFINPTLVPGAPQFAQQVKSGKHFYRLATNSGDFCHYKVEESTPGTELDVNIYLVGVNGITAQTAPMNQNMQSVLTAFDEIYAKAGVKLGKVRYFDITGADAQRFSVIRSDDEVSELTTLSKRPGDTRDDVLSLNIFFVRAFAMGGGAIGVSLGLPGPSGLHSTPASGVVFTSEFIGNQVRDGSTGQRVDGNRYTGIVMAHEVGHYLGLFHTTETNGSSLEPLMDTPQCARGDFPRNCPDLNNLMFPLAGITHTDVSANQGSVILANPLTKD